MDLIKVGLDFGTHQTKICVSRTPDEGHGLPEYEFFKYVDLKGNEQYFIPSAIQINKDDTLSYGFLSPEDEKEGLPLPKMEVIKPVDYNMMEGEAHALFSKYSNSDEEDEEGFTAIMEMLKIKYGTDQVTYAERQTRAQAKYQEEMSAYKRERNLFRYFKQATFAEYPWDSKLSADILCVWYLAYILFLLEDSYKEGFAINMGVPTDDKTFQQKKELGTRILLSALHLVEDVYKKDLRAFLKEKVSTLISKTVILPFSDEKKLYFGINIFPEAYASLIGLTSRGKLSEGMSINADIGGGTTDISFFIVKDRLPNIYKYWSIPRGLNYIAEMSGFDYSEEEFFSKANKDIVEKFNRKKQEIVYNLTTNLIGMARQRGLQKSNLLSALRDRILVYNGGGSIYDELTTPILYFTDVNVADDKLWAEEMIKDKRKVGKFFNLLTTSYGLAVSEEDSEIVLCDYENLFTQNNNEKRYGKDEIDKDVC